jgi:hypothetical protein
MAPWKIRESQPSASWLGVEHLAGASDREEIDAEMYGVMHEGQLHE